jgi:hypothetical protein
VIAASASAFAAVPVATGHTHTRRSTQLGEALLHALRPVVEPLGGRGVAVAASTARPWDARRPVLSLRKSGPVRTVPVSAIVPPGNAKARN